MPNYCDNEIRFDCDEKQFDEIIRPLLSGEDCEGELKELTFNSIVPMPDDIYRGPLGEEERRQYGKRNWYDWSYANWGCKWDAMDSGLDREHRIVRFTTAWCPPMEWYEALAKELDVHGITAHVNFYAEGGFPDSLGGLELEDGEIIDSEADDDFAEGYNEEEE